MDWKILHVFLKVCGYSNGHLGMNLTKTPYLVLFVILGAIGVTAAFAGGMTIFNQDVVFQENIQADKSLNVDGEIFGKTIDGVNQEINQIKNLISKPDVVFGTTSDNLMSILLGNGDGTFAAQPDVAAAFPSIPFDVAIGDLNNDGNQDVVVASTTDVTVLLGNGDATFTAQPGVPVGVGTRGVAIGDLNNDGKQDVVTANFNSNNISVLLNNGDGTFAKSDFAVETHPRGVAIGDLNNDGKQDVVVANESSATISIRIGNGEGGFFFQATALSD